MEAVGIVLDIDQDPVEEFEQGFRQHELPIWQDYVNRGIMLHASLTKLDISTRPMKGAVQYLLSVADRDRRGDRHQRRRETGRRHEPEAC